MDLVSFVDELVKIGAMDCLRKRADDAGSTHTIDAPAGLMDTGPIPPQVFVAPYQAATRLPQTAHLAPTVEAGQLGGVTYPRDPVDREKFNRAYRDRR